MAEGMPAASSSSVACKIIVRRLAVRRDPRWSLLAARRFHRPATGHRLLDRILQTWDERDERETPLAEVVDQRCHGRLSDGICLPGLVQ